MAWFGDKVADLTCRGGVFLYGEFAGRIAGEAIVVGNAVDRGAKRFKPDAFMAGVVLDGSKDGRGVEGRIDREPIATRAVGPEDENISPVGDGAANMPIETPR